MTNSLLAACQGRGELCDKWYEVDLCDSQRDTW